MICFPNSKINLGLRVVNKRADGYHNIETVFFPLPYSDVLEIIRSQNNSFSFYASGMAIDALSGNNLCVKAYQLLKHDFPALSAVQIHLHKIIPIGAGLGGGSADAAHTLQLLNSLFHLDIKKEKLAEYALQLGSDCPFFIYNKPCLATGRGEILEPIELDLSSYQIVLVNPKIHISTATAFANIKPRVSACVVKEGIAQPVEKWTEVLVNDFEEPVFKNHSVLKEIKDTLYQAGAVYASMSGSGSTMYGLFKKEATSAFSFPNHYLVKKILLG